MQSAFQPHRDSLINAAPALIRASSGELILERPKKRHSEPPHDNITLLYNTRFAFGVRLERKSNTNNAKLQLTEKGARLSFSQEIE